MKKIVIPIVVFIFLCIIGSVVGVMGYRDANPTSLLIYYDNVSISPGLILPSKNLSGEFIATENNLAIVRLRLKTNNRLNTTHLVFRIREKGREDWLVTNTYALDKVPDGLLYPFGFPKIKDSKGRVFKFELSSPDGKSDNAISI